MPRSCTAARRHVPFALLRGAGAQALSLRPAPRLERDDDAIGEAVEAGTALFLGVVPATDAALPALRATAEPVRELWRRLGFPPARLAEQVVITPAVRPGGRLPAPTSATPSSAAATPRGCCVEAGGVTLLGRGPVTGCGVHVWS